MSATFCVYRELSRNRRRTERKCARERILARARGSRAQRFPNVRDYNQNVAIAHGMLFCVIDSVNTAREREYPRFEHLAYKHKSCVKLKS